MSYIKDWFLKRWREYLKYLLLLAGFELYYLFLMRDRHPWYLLYLDFLYLVLFLISEGIGFFVFYKRECRKRVLLRQKELIFQEFPEFENRDIVEHDVGVLEEELKQKFEENCELQDYVAKWCHELKLPLSAMLMMTENIADEEMRGAVRGQLERMNWQLGTMLLGCRMQSPLFDLHVTKLPLEECVKASIQNCRFFLIQKKFTLKLQVGGEVVYTDKTWLTYMLDQLIHNAVKYAKQEPAARILSIWTQQTAEGVGLFVEDAGEGILESDIRRIFEKGYTGSNYHNGKYKSTGMGLYMVKQAADRLGHPVSVESEPGKFTRFLILFENWKDV